LSTYSLGLLPFLPVILLDNFPIVPNSVLNDVLDKFVDLSDVLAVTRLESINLNFQFSDVINHLIENIPFWDKAEAALESILVSNLDFLFNLFFKLMDFYHDLFQLLFMLTVVEIFDAVVDIIIICIKFRWGSNWYSNDSLLLCS
jgi:hypothetical protein